MPKFQVALTGNPSSCIIEVNNKRYRSLIDSGSDICLINKNIYNSFKHKPQLQKQAVLVQSVNGGKLNVEGSFSLKFKIGNTDMEHTFYVVSGISRNFILGRDWLSKQGIRIHFDTGHLIVNNEYIKLEDDMKISSIVRLAQDTILKPHSVTLCTGKLKRHFTADQNSHYEINGPEQGFLTTDPGLSISPTIINLPINKCPMLITNNTGKTVKVKRGCIVASVSPVKINSVASVRSVKPQQEVNVEQITDKAEPISDQDIRVDRTHLPMVSKIVNEYSNIFITSDTQLGCARGTKMTIDVGNTPPIRLKPYRCPISSRQYIEKAINDMLQAGIIRKSNSEYAFPVILADKSDGSKRFIVDFRKLNALIKPISFPISHADDLLNVIGGSKFFTHLDLKQAYWQYELEETSKDKTAFITHVGHYEFNRCPYGLTHAPQAFQRLMSEVLEGCRDYANPYLDDILIHSKTIAEHEVHIRSVLGRLRLFNLKLKINKCTFLQEETKILGFVINEKGIKADEDKVKDIRDIPAPKTVKQVRGFIGATSFFRRFYNNYSKLAEPLIKITRKNAKFEWTPECENSFQSLKSELTRLPYLCYPDMSRDFILYTDCSDSVLGGVLCQRTQVGDITTEYPNERPIYFISHKLNDTQRRYSTIEKECYAIFYCLSKLDHYLHNSKFVIRTDHEPLKHIFTSPITNKRIQVWALGISGYNCQIEYWPGRKQFCADWLSRLPHDQSTSESETYVPDISDMTYKVQNCHVKVSGNIKHKKRDSHTYVTSKVMGTQTREESTDDLPEVCIINTNLLDSDDLMRDNYPRHYDLDSSKDDNPLKSELNPYNMIEEQNKDTEIVQIKLRMQQGKLTTSEKSKFLLMDGVLHFVSNANEDPIPRLYVPSHLRKLVISGYHYDNGHPGTQRLLTSKQITTGPVCIMICMNTSHNVYLVKVGI